jgi:hypothetical protein
MDAHNFDISFVRPDYLVCCRSEEVIYGRMFLELNYSRGKTTVNTLYVLNDDLP